MNQVLVDGALRVVLHSFSADRVLVDYGGLVVFADRNDLTGWELSGRPATAEELLIYKHLVGPDRTEVTHSEPDLPPPDDIIPGG